jgi:hypothetical protein
MPCNRAAIRKQQTVRRFWSICGIWRVKVSDLCSWTNCSIQVNSVLLDIPYEVNPTGTLRDSWCSDHCKVVRNWQGGDQCLQGGYGKWNSNNVQSRRAQLDEHDIIHTTQSKSVKGYRTICGTFSFLVTPVGEICTQKYWNI